VKTFTCSNCDGDTRIIRGEYDLYAMGIPAKVRNMKMSKCKTCGNIDPIIAHMDDLMRTVALAVVCSPSRLQGRDVRFLRKYIGKTAEEFGKILNVDKTTVSKWENGHDPVGDQSDRLIRVTVIALGDGLEEKLKAVVENLPQIGTSYKPLNIEVNLEKMSYQYA
jgi:DNA-binding transcriptional regulator YiaG